MEFELNLELYFGSFKIFRIFFFEKLLRFFWNHSLVGFWLNSTLPSSFLSPFSSIGSDIGCWSAFPGSKSSKIKWKIRTDWDRLISNADTLNASFYSKNDFLEDFESIKMHVCLLGQSLHNFKPKTICLVMSFWPCFEF